jgi:hypothetical protein
MENKLFVIKNAVWILKLIIDKLSLKNWILIRFYDNNKTELKWSDLQFYFSFKTETTAFFTN